jgi:hypothetical protein
VTAPPVLLGVFGAMEVSTEYTAGFAEYARLLGGTTAAFTVMLTPTVALPAELAAVIVYATAGATAEGIPAMTPVEVFRLSPGGRVGDTEYLVTAPPLLVGAFAVIAMPTV